MVTTDSQENSVVFEVSLDALGPPQDARVWFENYNGADSFEESEDRAPNAGGYVIEREAIPSVPLPVLPFFAGAVAAAVLILRRRRSR